MEGNVEAGTTRQALLEERIIGIVREPSSRAAVDAARKLIDAGLRTVEISMTTPGAIDAIDSLARAVPPDVHVGAGTVMDEGTARAACAAGARFLVSPITDERVVSSGHRDGVVVIPGALTPTEIQRALDAGADLVKLFPAGPLGLDHVRAILAPLPHAPLVPTGGIRPEDAAAWLQAGAVAVGIGSALTRGSDDEIRGRVGQLIRSAGREAGHPR